MRKRLISSAKRLLRAIPTRKRWAEDGSVSAETVIILPIVAWALMASFAFTDAFRNQTSLQKSVYTASDLVSRASGTVITPVYLNGIYDFMLRMNDSTREIQLRMSLIGWDEAQDEYRVVWSHSSPGSSLGALDDTTLNSVYSERIPTITLGETLLLTEGTLMYEPPFRIGLQPRQFFEIALTRPRFSPGISFLDPDAPPPPEAWCEFVVGACGM